MRSVLIWRAREMETFKFVRLSSNARKPVKGSRHAAGLDLFSAHDCLIRARDKGLCSTEIKVELPAGTYGRIAPRSGLANEFSLHTGAGVIDPDYRGPVHILLFNHSNNPYMVKAGDRIAQLILEKCVFVDDVIEVDTLSETERAEKGFSSSGM